VAGKIAQKSRDPCASQVFTSDPGAQRGQKRPEDLLDVSYALVSASYRGSHCGTEQKRAETWAQTDKNPGDQSGRVDVEPSRVHLPKALAIELLELGVEIGVGLGEHQVSGDKNRSEKSVGIAVLAYLFVLRVCHHEIVPGKPWSIFQLQHALRLQVMTNQVEHKVKVKMGKIRSRLPKVVVLQLQGVNSECSKLTR